MKKESDFKTHFHSLLKGKGISISKLSRDTGISKSVIHAWCNGGNCSLRHLKALSTYLQTSVHELCWGTSDPLESAAEEVLKDILQGDFRISIQRIERKKPGT